MALIKERSKKRKGENAIGKIIYGFLLFAPLMVIAFTSLYAVLNKNAFESYYGETINEQQNIYYQNNTELQVNIDNYFSSANNTNLVTQEFTINCSEFELIEGSYITNLPTNIHALEFKLNGTTNTYIRFRGDTVFDYSLKTNTIMFRMVNTTNTNIQNFGQYFYKIEYNKYSYLDNNFEYGCYKAENSTLFNWAKNTGTYQVLETTTTGLGITNTFVPFLMAYWLLISVIYFIFDIALILIWMVHDKIHELKDSI